MRKSILFITMLAISLSVFPATLKSLDKEQFNKAFLNKTAVSVPIDVFNGKVMPKSFSYYLDDKGNVKGKFGVKPQNEPQTDEGVYTVEKDGTVYVTWKHWYGGKKICFRVFDSENAYLSLECNNVFHTAYLKNDIKEGNQLD